MKKIWKKYYGVIFFYSVIICGVFMLNARFKYLNELEIERDNYNVVAVGD